MTHAATPKTVLIYADATGMEPFTAWLEGLRDVQGRRRILTRLRRVEQGNYGDYRPLQDGVYELSLPWRDKTQGANPSCQSEKRELND